MSSVKAVIVMIIFSGIVAFLMNMVGLNTSHTNPLMALLGAVALLAALIGNVTIFLKIAGEEPFRWFKD